MKLVLCPLPRAMVSKIDRLVSSVQQRFACSDGSNTFPSVSKLRSTLISFLTLLCPHETWTQFSIRKVQANGSLEHSCCPPKTSPVIGTPLMNGWRQLGTLSSATLKCRTRGLWLVVLMHGRTFAVGCEMFSSMSCLRISAASFCGDVRRMSQTGSRCVQGRCKSSENFSHSAAWWDIPKRFCSSAALKKKD